MVEPVFGVLGAVAVTVASTILPYALSFAAGAMIYIVADDILPEAHTRLESLWACCEEFNFAMFFYNESKCFIKIMRWVFDEGKSTVTIG